MNGLARTDLKNLAELLNSENHLPSQEDDIECIVYEGDQNPHSLAYEMKSKNEEMKSKTRIECIQNTSKNIWSDDEVVDEEEDEKKNKSKPEYEMIYQQSVTPDDVFLQMSGKDPGSHSCECLLIKIKLPGIKSIEEVCLDTSPLKLICKTKKFYLNLDLPNQIDPVQSEAKWHADENILIAKLFFDINVA